MQRDEFGLLNGSITSIIGNIKHVTEYVNGLRHGPAYTYQDDSLVQTAMFEHGKMVSVKQHNHQDNRMVITADNLSGFLPGPGLISVENFCYATSSTDTDVKMWLLSKNYKNATLDYLKPKSHVYGILNNDGTGMAWNDDYAIMFTPWREIRSMLSSHYSTFNNIIIDLHVKECLDEIVAEKKLLPETAAYLKLKCL